MSKSKTGIQVDLTIDLITAEVKKAGGLKTIQLPTKVDPTSLTVDDDSIIYGICLQPADDKDQKLPSTVVYPAIRKIIVDTLQGKAKPGYVVVNGTIEIPKETSEFNNIEEAYFSDEEHARMICRTIADVELERSVEAEKVQAKVTEFLTTLRKNDRW